MSGSGYGGPFSGPGFDSMWTDMSEIVRPTRDGIHGREYISTSVDIGRKLPHLAFDDGQLTVDAAAAGRDSAAGDLRRACPQHWQRGPVVAAVAEAAAKLGTLAVVPAEDDRGRATGRRARHVIPLVDSADGSRRRIGRRAPMVMVADGPDVAGDPGALEGSRTPTRSWRFASQATPGQRGARRASWPATGAEVIHLVFDAHGPGGIDASTRSPRHMPATCCARSTARWSRTGMRDEVTLIASGGIALAEHMAKAIICGADLVAIDVPLLLALECRLCGECERGEPCPVALEEIDRPITPCSAS